MTLSNDIRSAAPDARAGDAATQLTPEPLIRLGFGFWGSRVLMSAGSRSA